MDIFNSFNSSSFSLNEQLARHIFEYFSDSEKLVVIMDRNGNCWPSDSERFNEIHLDKNLLNDVFSRIDDGEEPLIVNLSGFTAMATQLTTEKTNCGYIFLVLPQDENPKEQFDFELMEILLNQLNLVARLIEKNSLLHDIQLKNGISCLSPAASVN